MSPLYLGGGGGAPEVIFISFFDEITVSKHSIAPDETPCSGASHLGLCLKNRMPSLYGLTKHSVEKKIAITFAVFRI